MYWSTVKNSPSGFEITYINPSKFVTQLEITYINPSKFVTQLEITNINPTG